CFKIASSVEIRYSRGGSWSAQVADSKSAGTRMTTWQRLVHRPQGLGLRKAVFQLHLWIGIGVGLYILTISISGSAIVFRRELISKYSRGTVVVSVNSRLMTAEELRHSVQRAYPTYEIYTVSEPQR